MSISPTSLSTPSLGYLNYLHRTLTQSPGQWDGFYQPLSPTMNFALRYQLAFATYALAAMSQRTPAYRAPYAEAMRAAIERMLDVAAWGYWHVPEAASTPGERLASSGHVAVLISPHQRTALGPPSDPIARDNLQYSGHLSTMLGLYERVSGDRRYDSPFSLHDPQSGASYTYTHSEVAGRIYSQMRENGFGGVCCERGMAYVPCNNYAMASNTLHDALHGTHYSAANGKWLETVRDKMVLHGPAARGIFGTSYVKDIHIATPVAFNFTDAWGLAFLAPFDRPLVRKLYGKFKKKVVQAGSEGAYVGSSSMSERMEISDVPVNTGFGLILARAMGDANLEAEMLRYSSGAFNMGWNGVEYTLKGAPRTLQSTALFALAGSIAPGGGSFARLFHEASDLANTPYLDSIEDATGRARVFQAEYNAQERTLYIGLRIIGEPDELGALPAARVILTINGLSTQPSIEVDTSPISREDAAIGADGKLRFSVVVLPGRDVRCKVQIK